MIIDFHTHIFPEKIAARTIAQLEQVSDTKAFTDGTLASLKSSMEEAQIDLSVILPVVTKPGQFASINQYAKEISLSEFKEDTCNLLSFGGIHPDTEHYKEEIDRISDMGLKGIKLHPDYQEVFIDDIRYMRIIDRAVEKGLLVSVHGGLDVGLQEVVHCTPDRVLNVINSIDTHQLIIAHAGGYAYWDEVEELLVGSNLYFDTGYTFGRISDEQLLRIISNHGADKILFATDSPWSGQKEDVAYLRNMMLPEEEKELIFWKNAWKLLRL